MREKEREGIVNFYLLENFLDLMSEEMVRLQRENLSIRGEGEGERD